MVISKDQLMPLLMEACPSYCPSAEDHILLYPALGDFARHLLLLQQENRTAEFPHIARIIEHLYTEGDRYVREAATIGLLEGIQNVWANNDKDPELFARHLLPVSARCWNSLNDFWDGKSRFVGEGPFNSCRPDTQMKSDFETMAPAFSNARFKDVVAPDGGVPDCFSVITACNPDGITVNEDRNEELTEQLMDRLDSLGLAYFPVTGYDPHSPHGEPGFGIACEPETAIELGKEFRQVAVFRIDRGMVYLVSCGAGREVIELRPWAVMWE